MPGSRSQAVQAPGGTGSYLSSCAEIQFGVSSCVCVSGGAGRVLSRLLLLTQKHVHSPMRASCLRQKARADQRHNFIGLATSALGVQSSALAMGKCCCRSTAPVLPSASSPSAHCIVSVYVSHCVPRLESTSFIHPSRLVRLNWCEIPKLLA